MNIKALKLNPYSSLSFSESREKRSVSAPNENLLSEIKKDAFEREKLQKQEDAIERKRAFAMIFSFISLGVLITSAWIFARSKF